MRPLPHDTELIDPVGRVNRQPITTCVGVDVGGTKIAAGLIGPDGRISNLQVKPTPGEPEALLGAIVDVARAAMPDRDVPIGCGYPGMITTDGRIAAGPNIALKDFPLAEALTRQLQAPVIVENDATAAAWAEYVMGAGRRAADSMAMITLGTGVGGGLVLGGQLFRGTNGFGAELGHVILRAHGRVGPSGIPGEIEAYCSGTALRSLAVEAVADGRAEAASPLRNIRQLSGQVIAAAARAGDRLALELIDELGRDLGIAMASIVNLLDVEVIVIGGGMGAAEDLLLDAARASMWRHVLGAERRPAVAVLPAELGNEAGMIGAGLLAAQPR